MSHSGKITGRRLRLVLTLIVFFYCKEIAVGQERIGTVASVPNARGPASGEEVTKSEATKSPSISPLAGLGIGEGDLLQISVYGVPDFNQHVRVDTNGEVSLPMIGTVKVLGLSTNQVEKIIEKELKDKGIYNDPQVTVLQQEFGSQATISVLGEVTKPGVYPVVSSRKLFDMISAAGSYTPKAGRDILITHRTQQSNLQKITLPSDQDKQMEANVDVFPGDTILITKAPIVYVIGDVRLPGGFVVDRSNGLTILRALALAQGVTNTAKLNSSIVIHKPSEGPATQTAIDLKKILEGKSEDLKLEDNDILFVPHSGGKAAMQGVEDIMRSVAGAAIYRF
jgi:polysaccharide biosynthesis/export protein